MTTTPVDNATGINTRSDVVLNFDKNIVLGTGNIRLVDTDDNSNTIVIDAANPNGQLGIFNSRLTINPTVLLGNFTNYAVTIDVNAIRDQNGVRYAGSSDNTTLNFQTADERPTLVSTDPLDNATGVNTRNNIVLNFSENISLGTGSVRLIDIDDNSNTIIIDAANPSGQLGIIGFRLTINPTALLGNLTNYAVNIDANAIEDGDGLKFAGISDNTTYNFQTADERPTLVSTDPLDDATGVNTRSNIVLNFSENIALGTGNIVLVDTDDNSNTLTINAASPSGQLGINGSRLTINPTALLGNLTNYAVNIDANAIEDGDGLKFAGIADNTTYNFQTADERPTLVSTDPLDDATGVNTRSNIVLNFSENIALGTGNIVLVDTDDNSNTITINAASSSGQLGINGFRLTINPTALLGNLTNYAVNIDANAIEDGDGLKFAGISDNTTYNFQTADERPVLVSTDPIDDATGVSTASNLVLTFDQNIRLGTGSIRLIDLDDNSNTVTIDAANPAGQLGISGVNLTINPSTRLDNFSNYAVRVDANAIEDFDGLKFVGISDNTTYNFQTADESPVLLSSVPSDDDVSIATTSKITLTFDKNITLGTGTIQIINVIDNTATVTINVASSSGQLGTTFSNLTINPSVNLEPGTLYAVQIASTAIQDNLGNNYSGINDNTTLNFATAATTPSVSTTAATTITNTSAVLGGNVTDNGGASVTSRGIVYSSTDTTPQLLKWELPMSQ